MSPNDKAQGSEIWHEGSIQMEKILTWELNVINLNRFY